MDSEKEKEWKAEKDKLEKLLAAQTSELQQKNWELEIEAATQRVRAVSMGLQQPDDIRNVLNVMKEVIGNFNLGNIATWIWIRDERGLITQWSTEVEILDGDLDYHATFDINDYPQVSRHLSFWQGSNNYYTIDWQGENLQELVNETSKADPDSGKVFQEAVDAGQIKEYWVAASLYSKGIVALDFIAKPPNGTEIILNKMASAFDMAYKRFEDLKKAEAQAREAKIETALERVRSRTMAMQKSDELNEVSILLYEELKALGINKSYMNCGFMEVVEDKRIQNGWMTRPDGTVMEKFTLPLIGDPVLQKRYDAWKNQEALFRQAVGGKDLQKHIKFVSPQLGSKEVDEMVRSEFPETVIFYSGNFDQGYLHLISGEPLTEEEETIFTRFTRVFQQTYTRFLDLQKAEKRAYESKVEASLERVRGMAAAMNHSDDLMQIAEEMFKELEILKINPLRYGLGMIDGEKKEAELWASTVNDGHYLDMLGTLSLTWHPMLQQVLDAWNAKLDEVIYELKGKELSDYYQKIGTLNPGIPNLKDLQDPKNEIIQYVSFFPFKSGALYAFTYSKPGNDGKSILKRFATVFEQAHIRFNDLQKAEKQARLIREERDRLEIALKELRATQDQLVQQEKLASLGQLTAGIAHEIKNPLNFVNNFSDVSLEMVEELREEVKRGMGGETQASLDAQSFDGHRAGAAKRKSKEESETKHKCLESTQSLGVDREAVPSAKENEVDRALVLEILDDIKTNLTKIHEHGTRADSIVKSMLMHSRGGSGKMESTDLNALVKEYVNLAFHGMRAGKHPIDVDIDMKLDDSAGKVSLIAEDLSRVIMNLCFNAFDAMREQIVNNTSSSAAYRPKLTVRTSRDKNSVTIEIEDNGSGILDEIKDKILQPFFTTKKGTQGTGLGLSITHDIVKAHGGNIDIQSQPGQTVFIIKLNG